MYPQLWSSQPCLQSCKHGMRKRGKFIDFISSKSKKPHPKTVKSRQNQRYQGLGVILLFVLVEAGVFRIAAPGSQVCSIYKMNQTQNPKSLNKKN